MRANSRFRMRQFNWCHLIWIYAVCKLNFFFGALKAPEMNIAEFANSVDFDEVAHNEPPHQDLHSLPSSL